MEVKRFGVMLDMSRNAIMKPQEVKNMARILKSFGYNMVQLYTEDTYEVEDEPFFGYLRGRYTSEELKDIVSYCEGIGMEVIPCIQTLAHLNQIFRWSEYQKINDCADILLVDEERTYTLIENMFKSLRKSFQSEYVHIGMDEAYFFGMGNYAKKHGIQSRFEVLSKHLNRILEIAKKYNFKPIMWSDMFFRIANGGNPYPENPTFSEEAKALTPKEIGLVYWDYYHTEKEYYAKMMNAHQQSGNEVWFAGGAWTWLGFASGNKFTLESMSPAMIAARENKIDNIFITIWGDNGCECSYYSVLPSLYAIRKMYDGEMDIEKIKKEFETLTGERFDAMLDLDLPNFVGGNTDSRRSLSKYMLYSDVFTGYLDVMVKGGEKEEYEAYAKKLAEYATKSVNYSYLFEYMSALCNLLSVKYGLGARTREAYQKREKNMLATVAQDYLKAIKLLEMFYDKFWQLWLKENKPYGFDVQDIRLGGLKQRLQACYNRLTAYCNGEIDSIPELEQTLLEIPSEYDIVVNHWEKMVTPNVI